jgi:hypothetical protein
VFRIFKITIVEGVSIFQPTPHPSSPLLKGAIRFSDFFVFSKLDSNFVYEIFVPVNYFQEQNGKTFVSTRKICEVSEIPFFEMEYVNRSSM